MHHLERNPEYANDSSRPRWQQPDDTRGLGQALCFVTGWLCALWLPTLPTLPPFPDTLKNLLGDLKSPTQTEAPEWRVCLSSVFIPFEIIWAYPITLGQNYLGCWKLKINTRFWRLECHQFKNVRLTFLFKNFFKKDLQSVRRSECVCKCLDLQMCIHHTEKHK